MERERERREREGQERERGERQRERDRERAVYPTGKLLTQMFVIYPNLKLVVFDYLYVTPFSLPTLILGLNVIVTVTNQLIAPENYGFDTKIGRFR